MDSLLSWLWAIPVAAVGVICGLIWYRTKLRRTGRNSPRRQRATRLQERNEQSIAEIATAARSRMTEAQTMDEVFAIGQEGLNKIKGQIKESRQKQRKRK